MIRGCSSRPSGSAISSAAFASRVKTVVEPTKEGEDAWVAHHEEVASATLVPSTHSWYMGSNVPGKPRRLLSYIGGVGAYRERCDQEAAAGYPSFHASDRSTAREVVGASSV